MKRAPLLLLAAGVALGAALAHFAAPWISQAAPAEELRPPRVPIVAVGSRITWNVPYVEGAGPQQTLDIYAPENAKDAAVIVYIHRGEWARGDKSEVSYKPKYLNEHGVVLVSVNYRLSDVAQHPAQVNDVAAALRWVHDNIASWGGSPERIVLMGHSAGCHIASMVGLDPRPLAGVGLTRSVLRGVVCWSGGAYDLPAKVAEGGMYQPYIEKNFGKDPRELEDASPVHHVKEVVPGARFLFVSAGTGNPSSKDLSERMAREITAAGGRGESLTLEGKSHFTSDYECGLPEEPLESGAMLLQFLERAAAPEVSN